MHFTFYTFITHSNPRQTSEPSTCSERPDVCQVQVRETTPDTGNSPVCPLWLFDHDEGVLTSDLSAAVPAKVKFLL